VSSAIINISSITPIKYIHCSPFFPDFRKIIRIYLSETDYIKSLNFDSIADKWSAEHFPTLQNNSLKLYRPCKQAAVDYFGDIPIAEITVANVKAYIDYLTKKAYAKKTIKERFAVLKQIFGYAIQNEYITANPCALVRLKFSQVQETPKRQSASPKDEEIIKTLTDDVPFGFFAKFLIYTGCRRGEALALTPKDVDFENKCININKTVEWVGNVPQIKAQAKTQAGNRTIPLPDVLAEELNKRKKQKYIFENEEHGLMHNAQVTRRWNALKKAAGIECTPHQLRHSYTTMLFDAGIDVKTAQAWIGHSDIKTTLNIYTHLSEQRQEQSKEKWFAFVSNTTTK
jgi:integrase